MMRQYTLNCLGTADGWPDAKRGHSAYLYRFGSGSVLVDAGDSVERAWTAAGLDWNLADALVFSHMHSDHVGGLFMLLQGFWLKKRSKPLAIFLPEGALAPLRTMLHTVFFFERLLPFRLELRPMPKRFTAGGIRVTPHSNSHLDWLRARFPEERQADFSCYSLLLESGGKRVVHSADIGEPADLSPLLGKPVDLLLCELAHFEPEDLFRFLQRHEIRQAVFTHLSAENRKRLGALRRLAKRLLPRIPHRFVDDGDEVRF